jgi:hypothetical protein
MNISKVKKTRQSRGGRSSQCILFFKGALFDAGVDKPIDYIDLYHALDVLVITISTHPATINVFLFHLRGSA